ncbi:Os01g0560900 [Oryza sativa Japonica Group]|uniref:Os01g0560900 protein n=1 Tax=Oryza sativa subsp. japonica TaxID=39947 RepID=A0A0N7KD61_ORYSJ|nr:Os01g0560900 [Oryza sativa Japonica Group]
MACGEERKHVSFSCSCSLWWAFRVGGTRATGQGRRREVGADGGAHGGTPGAAARTAARSGWRRGGGEGGGSAVCRRRGSGSCFVHILMLDLIISYGVFGQRNADFEVAAVAATKTVDDESVESFVSRHPDDAQPFGL